VEPPTAKCLSSRRGPIGKTTATMPDGYVQDPNEAGSETSSCGH
jgi:hypothetical protein